jgi:ketosteroid isomerase-like protein
MKRFAVGLILIAIMSAGVSMFAQGKDEAEITAIDKSWGEAYASCNVKAWESLLAEDLVFIHNSGAADDKARQMKSIADCGIATLNSAVTKVRIYGGDTAIVQGNMQGSLKGRDFKFNLVYTRVYIKQQGTWKLVSHQSTDAPKKAS